MKSLQAWNEFWFAPRSTAPLGLFRLVLGCLLILWGLLVAPDLHTWFAERGVLPLSALRLLNSDTLPRLDVLADVANPMALVAIFSLYMLAVIGVAAGFYTRISTLLAFVLLISFHHRNPIILNSGDTFMGLMLLYLVFSPAGACYSVDRLLRVRRGTEQAGPPPRLPAWAQRLIQIQISIVYLDTFLGKVQGQHWLDGTAVYYPLHVAELTRFPLPCLGDSPIAINLLTYGTLAIELAMGTLVWVPRLRGYVLLAATLLHLGIEYAMNIPLFSFLMIASYINFLPGDWLERQAGRLARARSSRESACEAIVTRLGSPRNSIILLGLAISTEIWFGKSSRRTTLHGSSEATSGVAA